MAKKIKIPLLIASLLLTLVSGWMMYSRFQVEELWGYLPLAFFLGFWTSVVTSLESRFSRHPRKLKLLGLATLSGVLLSLGFPSLPFTALMFVAFVPLLLVEKELSDYRPETSKWQVFKYSYHTFVLWNILSTFWVANTAFFAGIFAIFLNSFFMAIPFVLFHQVKKYTPKIGYFAFAAFWLTFEYWHLRDPLSWPWLTLGNSFASFPTWVQWYEYTGVFGGSLWILVGNLVWFHLLQPYYFLKESIPFKKLVKPILVVLVPIAVSMVIYYTYEETGEKIEVVVVQPNFEPHYEKFNIGENTQMAAFQKLSREALTENTDYLVFPETSFGGINSGAFQNNATIRTLNSLVASYAKLKLVLGISSYHIYKKGEEHSEAVRTQVSTAGRTTYWEAYNAAIQLENGTQDIPLYKKSRLVPGAEYFPYRDIFFFMKPLVETLGGSLAGYGVQEQRSTFTSKEGIAVAPVICYESVYGEYSAGYVRNGAQAIFIVTNDGWWDNTAGHRQHLQFASLRAIETRRSIARSANTGISAFINSRGDISQATTYSEPAAIRGEIALNDTITTYVRWGDLIGRVSIFLTILFLVNSFAKRLMPKPG